jgi:hypothetical protein
MSFSYIKESVYERKKEFISVHDDDKCLPHQLDWRNLGAEHIHSYWENDEHWLLLPEKLL